MVGDFDLLQHFAVGIGLHERRGEAPVDGVVVVGADALKVVAVPSFAVGFMEATVGEIGGKENISRSPKWRAAP